MVKVSILHALSVPPRPKDNDEVLGLNSSHGPAFRVDSGSFPDVLVVAGSTAVEVRLIGYPEQGLASSILRTFAQRVLEVKMDLSRRNVGLVSLLAAAKAVSANTTLPSKTYRFDDLPVKSNGKNRSRAILSGETHAGFLVEMHLTELGPGQEPHPPHHHLHEEMLMIVEGSLDVTISGHTVNLGPGSSAYVASNEEHGWRNAGTHPALYFVVALDGDKS